MTPTGGDFLFCYIYRVFQKELFIIFNEKEIFYLKERHDIDQLEIEFPNKNFFTNNFIINTFVFIIAIISVITTMVIIYTLYKHNKLRALVMSSALQQVKNVKAEEIRDKNYKCECTSQFYIILALMVVMIGLVVFTILQVRRIRLCRGQLFLNVKIILFILDIKYYVPVNCARWQVVYIYLRLQEN